ncbi:Nuclear protein localization protein 4 [Wickerhamomyces ciferrii]|uniref:Nuclear protein localization protein 4 n=1 Tax=Wickerhamomyces ciferrii (strain ATCC 14091 / BCRC 22168 / CBS 111 / JCM 3599 / NBRC 0793 / NRRL Y-1031 F-60-10) TaxID=1206466 RepID=K0KV66_WICCF|nr:Nuclear protein localization protein 4 [Wickerhamomyces ciferrii]CCH45063.1 Nuclear protein localization protein 4 [Wickerhamomyces ciferrii]
MFRVSANSSADFLNVIEELSPKFPDADVSSLSISDKPAGPFRSIGTLAGSTPQELGFKNGEMLFISYESKITDQSQEQQQNSIPIEPSQQQQQSQGFVSIPKIEDPKKVEELPVDKLLEKEDGLIPRKRGTFCRHNDKGMCEYCSPLPPYDKGYREENQIKHASFHSHLKEVNEAVNKGTGSSYIAPLTESNFTINKQCIGGHEPWPKGICSKCQPSAITLQQQEFRMVDHVEFANFEIVNSFIESWRRTGTQRIGFLYGTYQKYDKVPLGIKAVVEAIYEPTQHDENDGLTLGLPWEDEERIDNLAKSAGLYKIGVIFSDLIDAGNGDGSVICKRHKDSYFLSSLEVIFAAKLQSKYPNYTQFSQSGKFSSKFVTCVVSGNLQGEIDIASYQVSEGAEGLVKADILTGSTHPSFAYINETNDDRYVPDIFYTKMNEYKLQVKSNAKPAFPVDYLLVTLSHGFPQEPNPVFKSNKFPIENRQAAGISQDFLEIKKQLKIDSFDTNDVINSISDFHLLAYLFSLDILSPSEQKLVVKIAVEHRLEDAYRLLEQPGWQTLLTIIREST